MSRSNVALKPHATANLGFKSTTRDFDPKWDQINNSTDNTDLKSGSLDEADPNPDNISNPNVDISKILNSVSTTIDSTSNINLVEELTTSADFGNEAANIIVSTALERSPLGIIIVNSNLLPQAIPTTYSLVLSKWHGFIESIEGNNFIGYLTDALGKRPDMRATFSKSDVSEGDRKLISENALFDWVISRERKVHGQITNTDFLIFKRFPMWKRSDLDKKSKVVEELNAWLKSSPDTDTACE